MHVLIKEIMQRRRACKFFDWEYPKEVDSCQKSNLISPQRIAFFNASENLRWFGELFAQTQSLSSCSTFWKLSSSFCLNFEVLIFRWFWCLKSDPFWFFWFFAPWKMILWFFVLRLFDFVQCFDFNTFKTWSLILIYTTVDFFGSCKRCFPWDLPTKTKSLF